MDGRALATGKLTIEALDERLNEHPGLIDQSNVKVIVPPRMLRGRVDWQHLLAERLYVCDPREGVSAAILDAIKTVATKEAANSGAEGAAAAARAPTTVVISGRHPLVGKVVQASARPMLLRHFKNSKNGNANHGAACGGRDGCHNDNEQELPVASVVADEGQCPDAPFLGEPFHVDGNVDYAACMEAHDEDSDSEDDDSDEEDSDDEDSDDED